MFSDFQNFQLKLWHDDEPIHIPYSVETTYLCFCDILHSWKIKAFVTYRYLYNIQKACVNIQVFCVVAKWNILSQIDHE